MTIDIHPAAKAWEAENLGLNNAAIVRKHGWKVGDVIIGHERGMGWWQDNALRIAWVGREAVMFESVASRSHAFPQWMPGYDHETAAWLLDTRPWCRASDAEIETIRTAIDRYGEPDQAGEGSGE